MRVETAILAARLALEVAAAVEPVAAQSPRAASDPLPQHYAESVALVGWDALGGDEVSVRLARFPADGRGTLWLIATVGDRTWGAALDDVALGDAPARTPVESTEVTFLATGGARARFSCRGRDTTAMACTVEAEAPGHPTAHPPLGAGAVPIRLAASFDGAHRGVAARPGRFEVFGRVEATVVTPEGSHRVSGPGKWHEQTGERPRFAGAFTYLSITGDDGSLLAVASAVSAYGFALLEGRTVAVRAFEIEPLGTTPRRFTVTLEDGRAIDGTATVARETSVPIEGLRRPSATVRVLTSAGAMIGHLNDWRPSEP